MGQEVEARRGVFHQAEFAGIVHDKEKAVGEQERTQPEGIARRAGPESSAVETQADELPVGPRAVDAAVVENGRVLGRAEIFGTELPDRFRHEGAGAVAELEEEAAGIVAAGQENFPAVQNERGGDAWRC